VAKQRFRSVSQLARDVGGGRIVAPGETAYLDDRDEQVAVLEREVRLVRLTAPAKAEKTKTTEKKSESSEGEV